MHCFATEMSLAGVAKETLKIIEDGGYSIDGVEVRFAQEQARAVEGTVLYEPSVLEKMERVFGEGHTAIEVTAETTQVAAHRLAHIEKQRIALLNFASARNPGGGFVKGAKAQEEDIARCSGLYPCLLTQPAYYERNRAQRSLLYTDHIIYSPDVPFFRTRSRELLDHFFLASVITAPAPNAGQIALHHEDADVEACLRRRAGYVLAVAAAHEHRALVLGAWGCGVFRNDPAMVADVFGHWLENDYRGAFDRVVFAILDKSQGQTTLGPFAQRFAST
jgi:uncharacterized protein (TIGR02452 family)